MSAQRQVRPTDFFARHPVFRYDEFVAAQEEARAAQRGIWDPDKQHYLDYDLRIAWWNRRADFIAEFKREAAGAGVSSKVIASALNGVTYDTRVIKLDRNQ